MAEGDSTNLTLLLKAAAGGTPGAVDRLWSAVYEELRRLARGQLAQSGGRRWMDSTTLVHEAYLRLVGPEPIEWDNRRHFFGAAARAMRNIRVDAARRRAAARRGGDRAPAALDGHEPVFDDDPTEVMAVDEALRKLEAVSPRRAEVVMLRYFAGLSIDETAQVLGVAPRSVDEEWRFAKAWLHRELSRGESADVSRDDNRDVGSDRTGL